MAKIPFSKLNLKKNEDIKTINIGNVEIEVKQYLPVDSKLDLIATIISEAEDENKFINPGKVTVIATLNVIFAYTNLSFTEKQKEDLGKLYDLLRANGVISEIIKAIPPEEYQFIDNNLWNTISEVYKYKNSVLGILDAVSQDYSNLNFDASEIQEKLADKDNLKLLKDVLTKLG